MKRTSCFCIDSFWTLHASWEPSLTHSYLQERTALGTWLPSDKDLKKAKLSEKQIRLMKKYSSSEKFDVSMLISLLRHFCLKASKNHPLWDETDNSKIPPSLCDDIANIVRIRNLRNQVGALFCIFDIVSLSACLKLWFLVIYCVYWPPFDMDNTNGIL